MTKTFSATLCFLSVVFAFGVATGCDEPRGSIEGTVYNEDGMPGTNLVIRAGRPSDPKALLRTGEDGTYRISNGCAGEWTVEFYNEIGWQVGLETVTIKAGETLTLDFTIGEKPLPEGVIPSKIQNVP